MIFLHKKRIGDNLIKFLLAFLLSITFVSIQTVAKAQNVYDVNGTVKKNKKKLEGAVVSLYRGSTQVQQVQTTSNGRFNVKLEFNAEYTLTITKPGHIAKKFYFNTKGVPEDRMKEEFGGQDIEVSIFELPKDPAVVSQINSVLSQPIAKFYYDDAANVKEIAYDKAYSQSMLDALAKINEIEKEANKKAEEENKKKAELESAIASKYEAAIIKGDAAFGKKDYTTARAAYEDALSIKVGEPYPKGKIVEIEKLLADAQKNAQIENDYKAAIAKGDAALTSKDYPSAKNGYNEALKLKPAEAYPKTKLAEIDAALAKQGAEKELNAKYDAAIAKGDKAFAAKTYEPAKAAYNEALALKAAEKYPKDKIAEIDKILGELANKEKAEKELNSKYDAAIAKGDKALAAKDYPGAKVGYNEALALKSAEAYPKTKLAEIDKILADLAAKDAAEKDRLAKEKELNDKYNAAIAKGDKALTAKTYDPAKAAYNEALALKPSEQYPKDKIAEITKILADLAAKESAEKDKLAKEKELNDKYNAAIAKGDKGLAAKDYNTAKAGYNEAIALKAAEEYPKTKLSEIEKLLADLAAKEAAEKDKLAKEKELNDKYNAAIAKGDKALAAKTYDAAKGGYNEALAIKPAEAYPKTKLAEIDKILADLASKDAAEKERQAKEKELNDKYNAAIAKGDKALAAKTYEEAKAGYNEALTLKSAEAYPKTKLAEIDKILADLAAKEAAEKDKLAKAKELEEKYKAAITKADAALASKDYTASKSGYTEALALKATEQYPKDKIKEIDAIVAKELGAKALEEKYNAAIAKGDKALSAKDYNSAKTGYTDALALKPSEQYPKDKLAEVDKALAEAAAEKEKLAKAAELEARYKAAVAKGDAALKAKTYPAAKSAYTEALDIKADEQYPKDKIAEVDALIAKEMGAKELDDKYKAAVAKGDAALKAKTYDAAKSAYNEALALKSAEVYPQTKIAEIDKILADLAAKDKAEQDRLAKEKELAEKYAAAVAKADASLAQKDYDAAKASYNEASGFKPAEKYPKDKIAEINAILAKEMGAKELEKKYADAIAKGDGALGSKDYPTAKTQYTAALALKPSEQYPKDKLAEVDKELAAIADAKNKEAALKAMEAKYAAAIAKGDKALAAKTYDAAKAAYNEALTVKSGEQYPKDKLSEIDKLIADASSEKEKAATEAKYAAAIAKGDKALAAKTYDAAKAAYNEALTVKSGEQYPKDKLSEIDKLIADASSEKEKAATEAKYAAAIAKGDKALAAKMYDAAKAAYNEALTVKSGEQYPKDKLSEIEKLIADASSEKEKAALEAKYKAALAKGDKAFAAKTYDAAKAGYNEAIQIKSSEQYPKDKLSEIDRLINESANKDAASKALNEKYNAAISKADAAFAAKEYDAAKAGYNEALEVKPAEKYPKDKIAAINALSSAKELEEKYKTAITTADAAYAGKDYAAAKTSYTEAAGLKPNEQYPKDQLVKMNALISDLAKNRAVQDKYDAAVKKADALLADKKYNEAIAAYKEAQAVKANEPYPANKISEINKTLDGLARSKEKDKQYTDLIAKGDKLFLSKDYKLAKSAYQDALLVKAAEKYPKDKIAELDVLMKNKVGTTTAVAPVDKKEEFTNALAQKYPEGITEELARENNAKVTRRIVVKGKEGHMYIKKETSFGPIYYTKDGVPITEQEFVRDTQTAE
jgi:Trp operon repressor